MADESAGIDWVGDSATWGARDWLGAHQLGALYDCNERFLDLLRAQAQVVRPGAPFTSELKTLLQGLDDVSTLRAARCAVLLADAGLGDAGRWARALDGVAADQDYAPAAFFVGSGAVDVMRVILTCAGHLAQSDPAAARLLLGMSPGCIEVFAAGTVTRIARLAETQWHRLRPRWHNRPRYWRDLLLTAAAGTAAAQARMRVRGLQLLAGEARAG